MNTEKLKNDILKDIQDLTEKIYIKYQTRLYITSGDISPLMALKENTTEERLADIITDVLWDQIGRG